MTPVSLKKRGLTPLVVLAIVAISACVSNSTRPPAAPGAPAFADLTPPDVPAGLRATQADRDQQAAAWRKLQARDLRGASRDYTEILRRTPGFYPAETGLGLVALADRQFKTAVPRFQSALSRDNRYVPAWRGLVDAQLGAGNEDEAILALEKLATLGPLRESDRNRLDLLRFKQVQTLIQSGTRARDAGRLEEADALLTRAVALAPSSAAILNELTRVEVARGDLDQAEVHARKALSLDAGDAGAHAAMAAVLDARGKPREAAAELAKAAAIDPAAYRDRANAARAKVDNASVPPELKDLARSPTVTRAQLAALIGVRLESVLGKAPKRAPQVVTDTRGHWAAEQIVTVTQSGVMEVFPNHTFQPNGVVRRADLAAAVSALLKLAAAGDQLTRWQAARPSFSDVPAANLYYRPAALAVTAGAMSADAGRFEPSRNATGAEVQAAVARIEQLNARQPLAPAW
ncbi:MAG TPA: tetratricopeptide repeat protein [Vicinamibacterales bacterium]|nr:tetratricopeptide repeat protein [Vicinamibacterales bacterium]